MPTIKERRDKLEARRKSLKKSLEKVNDQLIKLQQECMHPESFEVSHYWAGGYLDTARTEYTTYCAHCNMYINSRTVDHGYYG